MFTIFVFCFVLFSQSSRIGFALTRLSVVQGVKSTSKLSIPTVNTPTPITNSNDHSSVDYLHREIERLHSE
jgi:hypothetical protein